MLQRHENARPHKFAKRLSGRLSLKKNDDNDLNNNYHDNVNTDTNIDDADEYGYQSNDEDVHDDACLDDNDQNFYEEYKLKQEENIFVNNDLPYFELNESDGCEPILDDYASDEDAETSEGKVAPSPQFVKCGCNYLP
jgi:hypothetical protein